MSPSIEGADRWARAVVFACQKHARQTRDDGKTPYVVHTIRVAECLRRIAHEQDEEVLCAAVLHDLIEDSAVTFDDLARRFGDGVASLVAELSNDNRLPKSQRREAMLAHIGELTPRAKRIKLADRLDNVCDLLRGVKNEDKMNRYIGETERILRACAGACEPLELALKDALEKLRYL